MLKVAQTKYSVGLYVGVLVGEADGGFVGAGVREGIKAARVSRAELVAVATRILLALAVAVPSGAVILDVSAENCGETKSVASRGGLFVELSWVGETD